MAYAQWLTSGFIKHDEALRDVVKSIISSFIIGYRIEGGIVNHVLEVVAGQWLI
jgi:hypothetical protein